MCIDGIHDGPFLYDGDINGRLSWQIGKCMGCDRYVSREAVLASVSRHIGGVIAQEVQRTESRLRVTGLAPESDAGAMSDSEPAS